jgi:hypothetical protein
LICGEVCDKDGATASTGFHGVAITCVSAALEASPFEDDGAALEMFGEAIPNLDLVSGHANMYLILSSRDSR